MSGEQCWQRLRGPAGDDIPHTPREGRLEEAVRKAIGGLHSLSEVQVRGARLKRGHDSCSSEEQLASLPCAAGGQVRSQGGTLLASWCCSQATSASVGLSAHPSLSHPLAQAHLRTCWAPGFSGAINGQQLDLGALCAHWAALQVGWATEVGSAAVAGVLSMPCTTLKAVSEARTLHVASDHQA